MKRPLIFLNVLILSLAFSPPAQAVFLAGASSGTPTEYEITLKKIEFRKSDGTFVTYLQTFKVIDIAAVGANQEAGDVRSDDGIPSGDYTGVRVTISRNVGLTGTIAGVVSTSLSGAVNGSRESSTNLGIGVSAATIPSKQTIAFPNGATATTLLNNAGITESGNDLLILKPIVFTVDEKNLVLPRVRLSFDIANSMEGVSSGGRGPTLFVYPVPPPSVNVSID